MHTATTYPRLRRFAIDLSITTLFNVAVAAALTYLFRIHEAPFFTNLVFSLCIGTLAVTFIDGGRLLLWGLSHPPKLPFTALLAVSVPAAPYLGGMLAIYLLGISPDRAAAFSPRSVVGLIVMTVLACLIVTWFFWSRSQVEQLKAEAEAEKARNAAIEKQALQAQLQMLQAQIEPHMLFNTLANLQGLMAVDVPRAQQMLEQLIQYLRATLLSSRSQQTTLTHEFALIDAYLGLMKVRMGTRLSYTLQLPDALRDQIIPPMLLQPLVENAVKHGLEPKIEGGHVDVIAMHEDGMLTLRVIDNGLGLNGLGLNGLGLDEPAANRSGTHIGVANVRERLHSIYGARASFSLAAHTPTGTIATLGIPL